MFSQLDTRGICAEILRSARNLGLLSKPWSFCELQLGEADVDGLRRWAERLKPVDLVLDDTPFVIEGFAVPRAAEFGLVFALFSAEVGRREAVEGQIWTVMSKGHFRQEVERELFTGEQQATSSGSSGAEGLYAGRQPVPLLRKAMETAFTTFNLRHVFGRAGMQSWMDSVYLQFGVTRRGAQRLPWWLDNDDAVPLAVQGLLSSKRNGSDSFKQTWSVLRAVRRYEMSIDDARPLLRRSPWILEAQVDAFLEHALSTPDGIGEKVSPTLFSTPRLRWSEGEPVFVVGAQGVDLCDLAEDAYDICLDGKKLTRLLRQADGRYVPMAEITLPLDAPEPTLSLVTRSGETAVSETIELWPVGDEVVLYRLRDGRRVTDIWEQPVTPTLGYALLLASDLEIVPPAQREWVSVAGDAWRLYRIPPPFDLEVHLDGQLYWAPLGPAMEPEWASDVRVTWMRDETGVRLEVWHPADVTVQRLLVNRQVPFLTRRDDETTATDRVEVRGEHRCERLDTRLNLSRGGETCRARRVSSLDLVRMLRREMGATHEIDRGTPMLLEDLGQVRIFAPRNWAGNQVSQWCLMEGDTWISRPTSSWGPLRGLRGWGAPLKLRTSPYNSRVPDLVLLDEVRWSGCVRGAQMNAGRVRLDMRREVEVSDRHRMVVWTEGGELLDEAPASDWSVGVGSAPVAVAVAYDENLLGAWFRDDWSEHLPVLSADDPADALWLLSWMRPPLLSGHHARTVARFARTHAVRFLDAWSGPEVDDADLVVPRAFFERWRPLRSEAREVLVALGGEKTPAAAISRLLRIDPMLAARIMPAAGVPAGDLLASMAGTASMRAVQALNEMLAQTTAQTMGVELDYVSKLAKGLVNGETRIGSTEHRDARLALTVEPFRRFVFASYLAMRVRATSDSR